MFEFEKWLRDLLLPILKCKVGKKLIISDNLAAHISPSVINLCRETLQPLDVGVFGPLKTAWKKILTDYKAKIPELVEIQKSDFPSLRDALLKKA